MTAVSSVRQHQTELRRQIRAIDKRPQHGKARARLKQREHDAFTLARRYGFGG